MQEFLSFQGSTFIILNYGLKYEPKKSYHKCGSLRLHSNELCAIQWTFFIYFKYNADAIYLNKLVSVLYLYMYGECVMCIHCNYELPGIHYTQPHTYIHTPSHTPHTYIANIYCFLSGLVANTLIFPILSFKKIP